MKWALLSAALLVIALPALAQDQPGLRGAQSAAAPAAGTKAADGVAAQPSVGGAIPPASLPPIAPTGPPPLMSRVDQAAAQCSAACSRDYYFCLAGDNPDLCAVTWGQCRATCDITARRTGR